MDGIEELGPCTNKLQVPIIIIHFSAFLIDHELLLWPYPSFILLSLNLRV